MNNFILPLNYGQFYPLNAVQLCLMNYGLFSCPSVFNYLAFGKTAENPIVTATSSTQVVMPSAANKYLNSVTVKPAA